MYEELYNGYMDVLPEIIIGIISGLGGAFIGSAKPLIDWKIEKKRALYKKREKLILLWRKFIHLHVQGIKDFSDTEAYIQLRPYLSSDEIKKFEFRSHSTNIIAGAEGLSADDDINMMNTVVDRLAKKWKQH